jgi:formylglycine-generating enzyme required for sulfatase activity/tRNA A-37 threonylcarbamoyl transferase component Bud32
MQIRCPHCCSSIDDVDDQEFDDVSCPSCGSQFSLIGADSTATFTQGPAETLGRFTLHQWLGVGSFGAVWKARDNELDRNVAIKIPRKGQLDAAETERFLREARAAAQLKHPNIVGVHEVGREDGKVYIVSDLIEGLTLNDWLSGQRPRKREAARLCVKIAEALHHAHEQGVIHRDLKPGNVMLDRQHEPHVMDFGLAKREAGETTMTIEGQIIGTPAYMSPEQARGEGHLVDRRTDIYSLGVILFELLTGELPFRGNPRMLMHQLLTEDPPSPRKLDASIPRDLETICLKCLRREPDRRYRTCRELAEDLSRWLEGEPIEARPVSLLEKCWLWCRRRPAIAAAIATVLLTACIAAGFIGAEQQRSLHERARTAVAAAGNARGNALPFVIADLHEEFPPELVLAELRKRFASVDETRKQSTALVLADFGDVRVDYLVSNIATASPDEVDNFVAALRASETEAIFALEADALAAESEQDWRLKARLALLALHLDAPALARGMCQLRPDPIERTWFIEECSTWHGDLSELARIAAETEDLALRSAMILAAGGVAAVDVLPSDKRAWRPFLAECYTADADSLIHSAAGWTLRKWGLAPPKLATSKSVAADRNWHVNIVGMTMLKIPAGSFVHQEQSADRDPFVQTVTLSRPFLLSDREVTREQYEQFLNDPDCPNAEQAGKFDVESAGGTQQTPLQGATWYTHAVLYCNWLSRREGLTPCYRWTGEENGDALWSRGLDAESQHWQLDMDADGYRLPTEAEWELACRAGADTAYCYGDDESLLDRYGVVLRPRAELPGSRLPNAWGLFDMHGNVEEWCHDLPASFGGVPVAFDAVGDRVATPQQDPIGAVLRGGAFGERPRYAQSSYRNVRGPSLETIEYTGFRVARSWR